MQISRVLVSGVLAIFLGSFSFAAIAAGGSFRVAHDVYVEVEKVDDAGRKHVERVVAHKGIPGDAMLYVTTVENIGKKAADSGAAITVPVPQNTEYQAGSAYGDNTEITFSIDGGKNFASPEKLSVKSSDGYEQIASSSSYTNIRWTFKKQFAPGATGEVGFRAIIK
ncbi:MAG: hypothetical protein WCD45_09855 [Gallionella sp.]